MCIRFRNSYVLINEYKAINIGISFIVSNIMLYLLKTKMSNTKAQKLSLRFAPYLFIAVTILTAFGSSHGTWL